VYELSDVTLTESLKIPNRQSQNWRTAVKLSIGLVSC